MFYNVLLYMFTGILPPPQQFQLNFSNIYVTLSWVLPDSLHVSTPPTIFHYVLSNNLTNSTKTFNNPTTCNPLAYCNYSLDLRDPFFISVGSLNTTIMDYNDAISVYILCCQWRWKWGCNYIYLYCAERNRIRLEYLKIDCFGAYDVSVLNLN